MNESIDDLMCYSHNANDEECQNCVGYNSSKDCYVSIRSMTTMYPATVVDKFYETIDKLSPKQIRQYVRQWKNRKNTVDISDQAMDDFKRRNR